MPSPGGPRASRLESPRGRSVSSLPAYPALDTAFEVETPEHICFRYPLAGPALRAAAYLIDLAARGFILVGLGILAVIGGALGSERFEGLGVGVLLIVWFALETYVDSETQG